MKWRTTLFTLVFAAAAAVVLVPAAVQAQDHGGTDFTGKWELEFPAPWGIVVWTFDLEQNGETLKGKSEQGMGTLVLTGKVHGHDIEFSVDLHDGPHALSMAFGGAVESCQIAGEVSFEDGQTGNWTLTRVET